MILAFRAGLRWSEVIGLSTSDVRITEDVVELSVRDNPVRRTKSLAGRRLLPLHTLLDDAEIGELRRWWRGRLTDRKALRRERVPGTRSQGRLFLVDTEEGEGRLKRALDHALREVSGERQANFHMLRHSFGSYMLATLSLPFDLTDEALVPRLDPHLVSHIRRRKIAGTLWGEGRLGQNAVHVTGSLLGHSGNRATLRSYMHLTDWLAGVYVARPCAQLGLPTTLVAALLGKTEISVERADRRRAARAKGCDGLTVQRRLPGRQPKEGTAIGSIYLAPFIDAEVACRPRALPAHKPTAPMHPGFIPSWQSMAAVLSADTPDARALALERRDIDTETGRKIVAQLDALIAAPTRGRGGVALPRLGTRSTRVRQRAPRSLGAGQLELLERLYRGAAQASEQARTDAVDAFLAGYDRPRGVVRVSIDRLQPFLTALCAFGCRQAELTVVEYPASATVRVGRDSQTGRGFLWAMVMISAVHLHNCSAKRS